MIINTYKNREVQVEILDALFDKINMAISNVSITENQDDDAFYVYFEILSSNLPNDYISVNVAIYDTTGALLDIGSHAICKEIFLGFEVGKLYFDKPISSVYKVRLYPKIVC